MRVCIFSVDQRTGLLVDNEFEMDDALFEPEANVGEWWKPNWKVDWTTVLSGSRMADAIVEVMGLMEMAEFIPEFPYQFSTWVNGSLYRKNGGPA